MYDEIYDVVMKKFSEGRTFSLATVRNGQPTVRTMSGFSLKGKIYFQTDSLMDKAIDIKNNSHVALCLDEIQIQGNCAEVGHPYDKSNSWFVDIFKGFFPKAFSQYSHIETERVYEITPSLVKIWGKHDGVPSLVCLDIDNKKHEIKLFEEY